MTRSQGLAVTFGVCVIGLMGFVPPWTIRPERVIGQTVGQLAGYHFIFTPPPTEEYHTARIDIERLLIQWASAAAITLAVVLALAVAERRRAADSGGAARS